MAHFCEMCERSFTNMRCPRCGGPPAPVVKPGEVPLLSVVKDEALSDPGDSLDTMIEQASRPTLAALLTRGIKSGLIKPTHEYSNGAPTA
jgi:hypothetical protein